MHSFQNLHADIRFFEQKGLYSTEKQQKILYFTVFEIFFCSDTFVLLEPSPSQFLQLEVQLLFCRHIE